MKKVLMIFAGIGLVAAAGTPGDEPAPRAADEAAIRAASQALAKAFAKGDAKAVAAFWTAEGEYVDDESEPIRGREALEKAYTSFFADRSGMKVESATQAIRFLGTDTAIEEGTFTVRVTGRPANSSRFSGLYVRQEGRWLLALLKEWQEASTSRPTLQDLAWLIGSWESEGAGPKSKVTYEWTESKAFIRGKFVVAAEGEVHPGTQVIGVDPAEGTIRAWTFDPDGGFGDAIWTWEDGHWEIVATGTLADGAQTEAINRLTPTGKDAYTWRSTQRTLDGESAVDLGPIKVVRVGEGK